MKNTKLLLLASICFFIAGFVYLLIDEVKSVPMGGAFIALGTVNMVLFKTQNKEKQNK